MADRLELQAAFEEILGSRNVYFNPPASVQMKYDAIRYQLDGKDIRRANNKAYKHTNRYGGVFITRDPDTKVPDKLLYQFEMINIEKPYVVENLYHYPFTLYY
jgi:hypothetical protein